ncbi:MAG: glycosyltransferase [Candidatus Pacebacteria bacterium]|nr:glycosyltransferase [Candidatus Paceibacterota bacterium]
MNIFKNTKIFKFIVSGFLAYSVELLIFKFILEEFRVWYLVASSIALVLSFFVSFSLQKFWTFKHKETVHMKGEILMYLGVVIINLILNAVLFYLFVEFFNLPSLLGRFFDIGILKGFFHERSYELVLTQTMTAVLVGLWNFWFYKKIIFKDHKMGVKKLLFITQILDNKHTNLGFVEGWLSDFAKNFDNVKVICLYEGEYNLPKNVEVFSLGKESAVSRIKYLKNFYKYIFSLRNDYDAVFVHMNSVYLMLGGPLWLILRKKVYLWYIHTYCDKYLRLGMFFVTKVFSAFKTSFPIRTNKLEAVGHGINTDLFNFSVKNSIRQRINFLMVSRIAKVKNLDSAFSGLRQLNRQGIRSKSLVISSAGITFLGYEKKLKEDFSDMIMNGGIEFGNSVKNIEMPDIYRDSDVLVNLTDVGNIDKVVFEAMACGCLLITSNPEFRGIVPDKFIVSPKDVDAVVFAMKEILAMKDADKSYLRSKYREYVKLNHSLENLPKKIYKIMNQ